MKSVREQIQGYIDEELSFSSLSHWVSRSSWAIDDSHPDEEDLFLDLEQMVLDRSTRTGRQEGQLRNKLQTLIDGHRTSRSA